MARAEAEGERGLRAHRGDAHLPAQPRAPQRRVPGQSAALVSAITRNDSGVRPPTSGALRAGTGAR